MKIKKILNNNAVVVIDNNEEKIAIGSGVAFQKKKNDIVNMHKVEKLFVMKEKTKFEQLLQQIPEDHFTITEEIIAHAEEFLGSTLNEHVHIALTDHVSFAIERIKDGIPLKNQLLHEIKILFKDEFQIGMWAIHHIEEELQIKMPVDEAAFIALHIHTARVPGRNIKQSLRQTSIIGETVQMIGQCLNIEIDEEDISYERLITHLRSIFSRHNQENSQIMDEELLVMIKRKFSLAYQCAQKIADNFSKKYGIILTDQELGYITIHIERLRNR